MKYRERDYGQLIKEKGFQSTNYRHEILILSKYLKHVDNMSKQKHVEFVYNLCKTHFSEFNEVLHGDMVDRAIEKGRKNTSIPIQLDYIPIQEAEIEFISQLELEDNERRVLLALLCHRKLANEVNKIIKKDNTLEMSKHINGSRKVYSHIKTMACPKGKFDIYKSMNILQEKGLITSTYDARLYLNFIDMIEDGGGIYMIPYHNFDSCGLYYDFYNKGDVIECSECGKLVRKKSNKTTVLKYCKKCAYDVKLRAKRVSK